MDHLARLDSEDLCFRSLVNSYVEDPRFLARPWLAREVEAHLEDPECRFVIVTAEPGVGKSTFLAQLAHENPTWPVYFIRRDQQSPLADVGAHSFLLRLGFQIGIHYPSLFAPEGIQVAVEQRVGTVAAGASVVAAQIDRFLASPFYPVLIRIQQDVKRNDGRVVGLHIGDYVQDSRRIPVEDLQYMALIDPASARLAQDPADRLVVLVDALDEVRYQKTPDSLLDWLCNAPKLPSNLRFVLTARPDEGGLRLFRDKQSHQLRSIEIRETDHRVQTDSRIYLDGLLELDAVADVLAGNDAASDFPVRVLAKADGNIGYLNAIGRELDRIVAGIASAKGETDRAGYQNALLSLLTLRSLPEKLEGLYAFFLNQIKTSLEGVGVPAGRDLDTGEVLFRSAWAAVYRPILGVLAVAFEPLKAAQIQAFGAIQTDTAEVSDALERLRQFLDLAGERYRLYHATLADFLTSAATRDNPGNATLYARPEQWHEAIVRSYRKRHASWAEVDWRDVDEYGLTYLARHRTLLDRESTEPSLDTLIGQPFMIAKLDRFGSHEPFRRDVELAIETAKVVAGFEGFLRMLRNGLVYANLGASSGAVPEELVVALAATGDEAFAGQALGHAALIPDADNRARAIFSIGRSLWQAGKREKAEAVFRLALEGAELIGVGRYKLGKAHFLARCCRELAEMDVRQLAADAGDRAVKEALGLPNGLVFAPTILNLVAEARFRLGDMAGVDGALEKAKEIIDQMHEEKSLGSKLRLVSQRVAALAQMDRWDEIRQEVQEAEGAPPGFYRSKAFSGLVIALMQASDKAQAAATVLRLLRWRPDLEPGAETISSLAVAARVLGAGGETIPARELALELLRKAEGENDARAGRVPVARIAGVLAGIPEARAFRAALTVVESIDSEDRKIEVLVAAEPSIGSIDGVDVLQELSRSIESLRPEGKVLAWVRLAQALEKRDANGAERVYQLARASVSAIEDPKTQNSALEYIETLQTGGSKAFAERASQMLRDSHKLTNERHQAAAMNAIARALARAGRKQEAREVLSISATAASVYRYSDFRAEALKDVAEAMGELGDTEGLKSLVEPIEALPEGSQSGPLAALAAALLGAGMSTAATEKARAAIDDAKKAITKEKDLLLVEYAVGPVVRLPTELLDRAAVEEMLEAVERLTEERDRSKGLKELVIPLAVAGDDTGLERLLAGARRLPEERYRVEALAAIAHACSELADRRWFVRSVRAIRALQDESSLTFGIEQIAPLLARPDYARTLRDLVGVVNHVQDPGYAARMLVALAEPYSKMGENDVARTLATDALAETLVLVAWAQSTSTNDKEDEEKDRIADIVEETVCAVGAVLARIGDQELAVRLLEQAGPRLRERSQAELVVRMAESIAGAVERHQALIVLDALGTLSGAILSEEYRLQIFLGLLKAHAELGEAESAVKFAELVIELIDRLPNKQDQSERMAEVGQALARIGRKEQALDAFRTALERARIAGREELYFVVSQSVTAVSDTDQLMRVYRTLVEVNRWWDFHPPESMSAFSSQILKNMTRIDSLGRF